MNHSLTQSSTLPYIATGDYFNVQAYATFFQQQRLAVLHDAEFTVESVERGRVTPKVWISHPSLPYHIRLEVGLYRGNPKLLQRGQRILAHCSVAQPGDWIGTRYVLPAASSIGGGHWRVGIGETVLFPNWTEPLWG
jgi:hypothetical protein